MLHAERHLRTTYGASNYLAQHVQRLTGAGGAGGGTREKGASSPSGRMLAWQAAVTPL